VDALLNVKTSARAQKWVLRNHDESKVDAIEAKGVSRICAQIMAGRGVEPEEADSFLAPTLRGLMPDPSALVDMDKAAARIVDAVENGENITVFADYDVDGGTSAAQIIRWGRAMGREFGLYVPDRVKEGYGPSARAFHALKESGADLVITVDCGAAATEALEAAHEIDLPIIVIDHHLMTGALPPAFALVNPNRGDDKSGLGQLAAAGVSFMLLVALNREARRRGMENLPDLRMFLDLAALGTICDVVPLRGLNRVFVAQGLKVMSQKPNPGIAALATIAGARPPFTSYHGGFILGPRINAGGRIGQADMGARLLSSDDAGLIETYAQELDQINRDRKVVQDRILEEALEKVAALPPNHSVIIIAMEGWHPGVIGIVAGRLKDRFNKPAIVIGVDEGIGKGSGRSLKGVNLGGAIQAAKEEGLLEAGGGHEMAAGLTIKAEKLTEFQSFMEKTLSADVARARLDASYKIDALISASAANTDLIAQIDKIGPYGADMPEPVFAFSDLRITFAQRLNGGHVRCAFEDKGGVRLAGIAFRAEETGIADILLAPNPPRVHLAARLKQDTWKGRTKIDVQIADLAIAT